MAKIQRLRARAGLDTVRELERVVFFNTTILGDELDRTPVDNRLMELAKANHGLILTNDYNLSKVAATEHIDTLNLNALALTLRNQYLPGERAKVKIVAAGSNPHQGVAYLRDGTMVVVDHASDKLGQEVEVEFIRLNQTASGTMLFAKLPAPKTSSKILRVSRPQILLNLLQKPLAPQNSPTPSPPPRPRVPKKPFLALSQNSHPAVAAINLATAAKLQNPKNAASSTSYTFLIRSNL